MASRRRGFSGLVLQGVGLVVGIVLLVGASVAEAKPGVAPILPKQYQGNGNVLQALLNSSWPAAQGPSATFTFFAPQNSAVKKYPCLFSSSASISKSIATNVLQYHIIPGKALSSQQLKNNAATADYMASTAFNGKKLNVTKGGTKVNGYSNINNPDIGTKPSQAIHGIATLLIGCGPAAPAVKGYGNKTSGAESTLSLQLARMRYVDIGIALMSLVTSLFF